MSSPSATMKLAADSLILTNAGVAAPEPTHAQDFTGAHNQLRPTAALKGASPSSPRHRPPG